MFSFAQFLEQAGMNVLKDSSLGSDEIDGSLQSSFTAPKASVKLEFSLQIVTR